MVNNHPIGIFDSGVGGLTVLHSLQNLFPNESFIYLGDTQNAPWGDLNCENITNLSNNRQEKQLENLSKKRSVEGFP